MTDDEINAVIHSALGNTIGCPRCSDPECSYNRKLNYCNDLNAMHEAEKVLTELNWFTYISELAQIVRLPKQPEVQIKQSIHATARQRAEAFLQALGKWKATDKESLSVGGATTEEVSADRKEVQE